MATWPEPQFDPPLPPFSSSYVGAWFVQFEAALALNHIWIQEFKHAVLLDVLSFALQLHLGVPSPGPRPYDELRQSVLNFYGAAYRPLSEVDGTVRYSVPTPSRPAPDTSLSMPVSHHQASLPPSTCPDTVSSTTRCATAQSPASGSLQGSLSCEYAHNVVAEGIVTTMTLAMSSPFSPPTMAGDSGDIADPMPATMPHAIGSVSNAIAPATTPDPSTRSAEPVSEAARELVTAPIPLPPTLPANATADMGHDLLRPPLHPTSGVLTKPPDTLVAPDHTLPGRPMASSRCAPSPAAPARCHLQTWCAASTCKARVMARPGLQLNSIARARTLHATQRFGT